MRNFYLTIFAFVVLSSCSKKDADAPKLAYVSDIYTSVDITSDVTYGSAKKDAADFPLKLDVYQPSGATETKRPLIILAHGGSFVSDSKTEVNIVGLCNRFTKRGYVVASIDYRLLNDLADGVRAKISQYPQPYQQSLGLVATVLNAIWDTRAAIRYFKNSDVAAKYKIDTSKIFIGGFSAGSICALQAAYVKTPAEFAILAGDNQALGQFISDYITANGGIEGASGNSGLDSSVKGVINIAGAVISPDIINAGEPIIVSAQAKDDPTVPYDSGSLAGTSFVGYGSKQIDIKAKTVGIDDELITLETGGHYAFFSCEDCKDRVMNFVYNHIK